MSILTENFALANGVKIPKIALGTWQISNEAVVAAVLAALKNGYRHIDTAAAYHNEAGVGKAVRQSGIAREQVFITTKIPSNIKTYQQVVAAFDQSLELLKMDYVDLMLIHAPIPWAEKQAGSTQPYFEENVAVWKALQEAYLSGKARAIGLSNFEIADVKNILAHSEVKPMANQIKYFIGNTQDELTEFCRHKSILIEGYSPLATGRLLVVEAVKKIAWKYGRTMPQFCLRYVVQRDVLPLPKSTHEQFIIQNSDLDFEISREDMDFLNRQTLSFNWIPPKVAGD
jgi:diketogulonate reductase-like aldo/keto reductase